MNWYLLVLKKYADFNGRARRKEYWMFFLFQVIFSCAAVIIDSLLGFNSAGGGALYLLYVLATLVPALAVGVRRLHDIGKSGWMILISLIPIIGSIWLIVLFATEGEPGTNQYGPDPKQMAVA
ncbi:MAG TPA: DUF805 domain-containing protein [Chryseolinea sp.]